MLPLARWLGPSLLAFSAVACSPPVDPFADASGLDARADVADRVVPPTDAPSDTALLGRVCRRNADCDDRVSCTDDLCGADGRCVNVPNSARCDDGVYCNGAEACDLRRGCTRGAAVTCDDGTTCTTDRCVESTRSCEHVPLDRDHDGDPDDHCRARLCGEPGVPEPDAGVTTECWRGHDCNDFDPRVSSLVPELCGDGVDNNCNGLIDAAEPGGCTRAQGDRCDAPLEVPSSGGTMILRMAPAAADYTLGCAARSTHDVVLHLRLDAPRDVSITASAPYNQVSLELQTTCGSSTNAVACTTGYPGRLRRHSLPAGDYFIAVLSAGPQDVSADIVLSDPTPPAANDSCAAATVIPPEGGTFVGDLAGVADDVTSRCGGDAPDVLYTFTLAAPQNVSLTLAGSSSSALNLSLLSTCQRMPTTLRCSSGSSVHFVSYNLPAGTYTVAVESYTPDNFTLQVGFDPPGMPPAGDTCEQPIALSVGVPVTLPGALLQSDYSLTCQTDGPDGVLRFNITARGDALVAVDSSGYLSAAVSTTCYDRMSERGCVGASNPRVSALGLDPGTYYLLLKEFRGADATVRLWTFPPATVSALPAHSDTCDTAAMLGTTHALYTDDNTMLTDQYRAPCNSGTTSGADAVYRFHLDRRQRVIVVNEAGFFHYLWVAQAGTCPGTAPAPATGSVSCALGNRTSVDVTLDSGDYFLFVDGYSMDTHGPYTLQVYTVDP